MADYVFASTSAATPQLLLLSNQDTTEINLNLNINTSFLGDNRTQYNRTIAKAVNDVTQRYSDWIGDLGDIPEIYDDYDDGNSTWMREHLALDYYDISYRIKTLLSTPMMLTLILGTVSIALNVLTIAAIIQVRSRWTALFRFMFSLMMSDLLVSVSTVMYVLNSLLNPRGPVGASSSAHIFARCSQLITKALTTTGLNITLLNLMAMALDHYIAILSPLKYYRLLSRKNTIILITVLWIIAIVTGFSNFMSPLWNFHSFHDSRSNTNVCEVIWKSSSENYKEEYTTFFIAFLCYGIMLVVYLRIYWKVRMMRRGSTVIGESGIRKSSCDSYVAPSTYSLPSEAMASSSNGQHTKHHNDNSKSTENGSAVKSPNQKNAGGNSEQRNPFINKNSKANGTSNSNSSWQQHRKYRGRKRNTRALITTLLILGTFMICWMPMCCFQVAMGILTHIDWEIHINVWKTLHHAAPYLYVLLLLNTLCDPVIYAVRIAEVRRRYRILYARLCCRGRNRPGGACTYNRQCHGRRVSVKSATFSSISEVVLSSWGTSSRTRNNSRLGSASDSTTGPVASSNSSSNGKGKTSTNERLRIGSEFPERQH